MTIGAQIAITLFLFVSGILLGVVTTIVLEVLAAWAIYKVYSKKSPDGGEAVPETFKDAFSEN